MARPRSPHVLLGGLALALVLTAATLLQPGPALQEVLDPLLLDEYRSEAEYQRVVDDLGAVRPFGHIVRSERRHAEMLLGLYARYDLDAPDNPYRADTSPSYATLAEACAAGVASEAKNAALYDEALALDLPDDVRAVLEHNRMATVDHHTFAFERCGGAGNGPGGGGMMGMGHGGMGPGPDHDAGCPHQGDCPHEGDGAHRNEECPRR